MTRAQRTPCLLAVYAMQAARMIGDSGEGWEDDVVPSMHAGMSQFMAHKATHK